MGDKSKIEWTDATWNPIRARNKLSGGIGHFCVHVSEGCRNCYAERMQPRFGNPVRYAAQDQDKVDIFLDEKMLVQPLRWLRWRNVFACSMTDLFAEFVEEAWLDRVFAVMALGHQHNFQVLTKRPERMQAYITNPKTPERIWKVVRELIPSFPDQFCDWLGSNPELNYEWNRKIEARLNKTSSPAMLARTRLEWPLKRVWLGTSVEDQATADERIPHLLATPGAIRFVSYEPALGPVDLSMHLGVAPNHDDLHSLLNWVIAGGESGPGARPAHPDWFRSVRDQCAAAGVAFHFKQWGEWAPHRPMHGGDLGGDVRAGRATVVHPTGQSDVEVFKATGGHNTIPGTRYMARVGKKRAGRLLDGVEHNGFPT